MYPMRKDPIKPPRSEDIKWAAELFQAKMRFIVVNRRYVLSYSCVDPAPHERLITYFGGAVYNAKGTRSKRWRLSPDTSLNFLELILPHLDKVGKIRVRAFVQVVDAYNKQKQQKIMARDRAFQARALARMGKDVTIPYGPIRKVTELEE